MRQKKDKGPPNFTTDQKPIPASPLLSTAFSEDAARKEESLIIFSDTFLTII